MLQAQRFVAPSAAFTAPFGLPSSDAARPDEPEYLKTEAAFKAGLEQVLEASRYLDGRGAEGEGEGAHPLAGSLIRSSCRKHALPQTDGFGSVISQPQMLQATRLLTDTLDSSFSA